MFVAPSFDGKNDVTASSPIVIALRSLPPNHILTRRPTFGWLLRPPIQQKPSKSKPRRSLYFPFFRPSIRRPKRRVNVLPTRSSPAKSPLQCSPCRRHHHFVDCYVEPTSGGNLRPVLRPSPNFLVGAIWVPQTRDREAARAHPMARAFHGPLGSSGAMSWWRRRPTHGGRGPKPLGVGRRRLTEVLFVVVLMANTFSVLYSYRSTYGELCTEGYEGKIFPFS